MAGETNRLFKLAAQLSDSPHPRETDVLVATGEQVSAALLAIRLQALGYPTVSFLGHQLKLATDSHHGAAKIKSVESDRIRQALDAGNIVVVAGYQGVDAKGDITTLGRGASDLTAVALAAALKADACEIYTDVEGVYTADPNICPRARKLGRISYDEMLEMAGLGAKVLQLRSVELARRYNVPLVVRSSFSEAEGTWVGQEDKSMEDVLVSGVTLDQNQSKITLAGVADRPGLAARIFGPIADAGIVVDMIIQNASADGRTDMTFTVGRDDLRRALELVRAVADEIGAAGVRHEEQVAKVSIVGLGMRTHAGVAATHVQGARGRGHQYRDDCDLRDQGLGRGQCEIRRACDARAARRILGRGFQRCTGGVGLGKWLWRKNPDLRHHAARRVPVGGRLAHGRGQARDRRAPRRSRHRLHRGRMAGLERARRGLLQGGQEAQASPRQDCGLRLDAPRRVSRASADRNLALLLRAETPVATVVGKTWDLHVREALRISQPGQSRDPQRHHRVSEETC